MKRIFILIITVMALMPKTHSQVPDEYLKDAIKKWQGVWQGVNGKDTLTFYIIQSSHPGEKMLKDNNYVGLYGWHKIIQKSKIIESTLEYSGNSWNDKCSLTGSYKKTDNKLSVVLNDITRNRLVGGDLVLLDENKAILKTWLKEVWRKNNEKYPTGQTFPKEIKLQRISTAIMSN